MASNDKPTLVFFGNERLATSVNTTAPTLRALISAGYSVATVVSHHSSTKSRNSRDLEIAAAAEEHGIPVLLPAKPADIAEQLASYGAEAAVLVAYGKIIPQSVIDIFPRGIINIHPSLLPLHRGPIPVESVILEGASETGVSIMRLAQAMDAGPVYGQTPLPLTGNESKQALADNLLSAGGELLLKHLPDILDGSLQPTVQNDATATYDELITKDDGQLDFNKPTALLEREIRAYLGWPGSRAKFGELDIIITEASVGVAATETIGDSQNQPGKIWREAKRFGFYTSDGVLIVERLKPAGKQEMSAEAFLAGYSR